MARARNIKPGFFTNDALAELPALTRLFFVGMWTLVDRDGRVEDRPKKLRAECMPYDELDAEAAIQSLADKGFLMRYEADGIKCLQVVNWAKHQNPHVKEVVSFLPAPVEHGASTVQAPCNTGSSTEVAGLIPDSGFPIPDSIALQAKQPRKRDLPCPDDVDPQVWTDWLALRKGKRAVVTPTTVASVREEAGKAAMTLEAFLRVWCARGSQGLQAAWLKPNERSPPTANDPAWRAEQKARNSAYLGPAMTGATNLPEFDDAAVKRLG